MVGLWFVLVLELMVMVSDGVRVGVRVMVSDGVRVRFWLALEFGGGLVFGVSVRVRIVIGFMV